MTTNCSYCTSILCEGCQLTYKESYTGKFFRGYKPQYYFRTTLTHDTNPNTLEAFSKLFK